MSLLTVIIPTIGRQSLHRAINSVQRQRRPTEVVVEHDPRRTGCGPTLNRGLTKVSTPWVASMGDDDTLSPYYTMLLERVLDETPDLDMVIFRMEYENGSRLPLVTEVEDLHYGAVGCSYAMRTELAREIGWINEPCNPVLAEDWEMIQAVRQRGGKIRIVHRVVYYVRHEKQAQCA